MVRARRDFFSSARLSFLSFFPVGYGTPVGCMYTRHDTVEVGDVLFFNNCDAKESKEVSAVEDYFPEAYSSLDR